MNHRMFVTVFAGLFFPVCVFGQDGGGSRNLLANGNLEQSDGKWVKGWRLFQAGGEYGIEAYAADVHSGKTAVRIVGKTDTGRACFGQRTKGVKVKPVYRLSIWYTGTTGRRDGFLRFHYGEKKNKTVPFDLPGTNTGWQRFKKYFITPKDVLACTTIQLEVYLYQRGVGQAIYDDVELAGFDKNDLPPLEPAEEVSSPYMIPSKPVNGQIVRMNPPDMVWPPQDGVQEYALQLSQDASFPNEQTITIAKLSRHYYNHRQVLAPGEWFWRFRGTDLFGRPMKWSKTRRFIIPADAIRFPVPSVDELVARVKKHPRVFTAPDKLDEFRRRADGAAAFMWPSFQRWVDNYLGKELRPEPEKKKFPKTPMGRGEQHVYCMRVVNGHTMHNTTRMANTAFAYLVTGERKYADEAKRIATFLATWDIKGATGYHYQDQSFRDIVWKMAVTYDCIYDTLSDQEKKLLQDAIKARASILYQDFALDAKPIDKYPFDSHGITSLGFLAIISVATLGDIPEAEEWFRFTIPLYINMYPPWGGADGGWSQGVSYWKWSCRYGMVAVDPIKTALGVDPYEKPWPRENGWFPLYFHSPFCKRAHFGDGNISPVNISDKVNVAHWAALYGNRYLKWFGAMIDRPLWTTDLYAYTWFDTALKPKPPVDVPQGKRLRDVGWVAMHSDLADPDDIMLMFKSSWYGSFNHSHADQNHFVIYAYGEPLVIDAGYYDWYGSPHHYGYTITTQAHNTLLIDGQGQVDRQITAKGKVTDFYTGPGFDYGAGDASEAYPKPLEKFLRHFLFVGRRYFVVWDEITTRKPCKLQWLLHSLEKMDVDSEKQEVTIARGGAKLLAKLVSNGKLDFTLTDQFPVPPAGRYKDKPNQWHLTAATAAPSRTGEFTSVLFPYRAQQAPPAITCRTVGEARVIEVAKPFESTTVIRRGPQDKPVDMAGLNTDGAIASVCNFAKEKSVFLGDGTTLSYAGRLCIESSRPVKASAAWRQGGVAAKVVCAEDVTVGFAFESAPKRILVNGRRRTETFDTKRGIVRLNLSAGESTIEIEPPDFDAETHRGTLLVETGENQVKTKLEAALTHDWRVVSFCLAKDIPEGLYDLVVEVEGQDPDMWLQINREKFSGLKPEDGRIAFKRMPMRGDCWVMVSRSLDVRVPRVTIMPSRLAKTLPVQVIPEADARTKGGIKIEAESFADQGQGKARVYTHRKFLSGGAGLNWRRAGNWIVWRVDVPQAGTYDLILKYATHESGSVKLLQIDGAYLPDENTGIAFPPGKGYGQTPAEWRLGLLDCPLKLSAGKHEIRMQNVKGLLNLDYLILRRRAD
ncbi:MAG: DUF4962 domain-containing protein [Planctomycetes bacterium]|nr:DUF4962 domain-containing protein [Planctomycetota bacterium]